MKSISLLIFLILITVSTLAQQNVIDSLKQALSRANNDSTKFCLSIQIGELYGFNNADSSIYYIKQATSLAENKANALWRAHSYCAVSLYFQVAGDFASALYFSFKNINEFEQYRDPYVLALSTEMISSVNAAVWCTLKTFIRSCVGVIFIYDSNVILFTCLIVLIKVIFWR